MTLVKVCGVTLPDDAAAASAAGVDFVGLNFWPGSKRHVAPSRGPLLAAATRAAGGARVVGVFVDAAVEEIASIVREVELDIVQLHGHESPETVAAIATETRRPVWKALSADEVGDLGRYTVDAILLDTPTAGRGGSGAVFDWAIARDARVRHPERLLVLAGGLTPANVAAAIAAVEPWAIDVASGVETAPGIKDGKKIAALVAAVRATR